MYQINASIKLSKTVKCCLKIANSSLLHKGTDSQKFGKATLAIKPAILKFFTRVSLVTALVVTQLIRHILMNE